jgi:hypothetical protein
MFDFIHSRDMAGSIHDYDRLFAQAYKHLRPGAHLEMQSFEADFFSDDETRARAKTAIRWQQLLVAASRKFGRNLKVEDEWAEKMRKAGFVDVVEEVYKVGVPVQGEKRGEVEGTTSSPSTLSCQL